MPNFSSGFNDEMTLYTRFSWGEKYVWKSKEIKYYLINASFILRFTLIWNIIMNSIIVYEDSVIGLICTIITFVSQINK